MGSIEDYVHEHMVKLLFIGQDKRGGGHHLLFYFDIMEKGLIFEHKKGLGNRLGYIVGLHKMAGLACKFKKFFYSITAPLSIFQNTMQIFSGFFLQIVFFQNKLGEQGNSSQRVV